MSLNFPPINNFTDVNTSFIYRPNSSSYGKPRVDLRPSPEMNELGTAAETRYYAKFSTAVAINEKVACVPTLFAQMSVTGQLRLDVLGQVVATPADLDTLWNTWIKPQILESITIAEAKYAAL